MRTDNEETWRDVGKVVQKVKTIGHTNEHNWSHKWTQCELVTQLDN